MFIKNFTVFYHGEKVPLRLKNLREDSCIGLAEALYILAQWQRVVLNLLVVSRQTLAAYRINHFKAVYKIYLHDPP